jgi:hypothetical protein
MRRLLPIVVGLILAAACNDNNGTPGDGPGKEVTVSDLRPDAPADLGPKTEGPKTDAQTGDGVKPGDGAKPDTKACTPTGAACLANADCCSGTCTNKVCAPPQCLPDNSACTAATDCCNLNCTAGKCGGTACISDNQPCTVGGPACCSTQCLAATGDGAAGGGKCQPLNPTCATAGNACGGTDGGVTVNCCSGQCVGGKCAAPSQVSYCTQTGDICYKDGECCTGVCTGITATKPAGTCAAIQGGGCLVDGIACSGCNSCCSSFCAPYGISGPHICQPASGCHVMGDLCHKDSDCCGGDATQLGKIPGAGLVKCIPDPIHPQIGTCSDPNPGNCPPGLSCGNACVPEGAACHYKLTGVGCPSNSTRNDCCEATGNKGQCQLDKLGIPRCYGLGACVPAGGDCASSADCCNNLPCVPDAAGHLKCGAAPCVPQGGVCTTTADCCAGMPCIVPPGALAGVCGAPPPPPPSDAMPKTDGPKPPDLGPLPDGYKVPDKAIPPDQKLPTCALYGQSCSATVPCCPNQGDCRRPYPTATLCTAGATDCTCYNPII